MAVGRTDPLLDALPEVAGRTEADLSNMNAGGTDVGSLTYRTGVALDATELAALESVVVGNMAGEYGS